MISLVNLNVSIGKDFIKSKYNFIHSFTTKKVFLFIKDNQNINIIQNISICYIVKTIEV